MNILAKKIIAGFGSSRVLGGNQFRKARASDVAEEQLSEDAERKEHGRCG